MHFTGSFDIEQVKRAAHGRWEDILSAVGGIDPALLDGKHHPCPKCGGTDRFRYIDTERGALFCNQCFESKNGDGVAALQWLLDCDFGEALDRIASHLEINGHAASNGQVDIVAEIARRRRIPLDEFRAFGAKEDTRGEMTVARVPMYGTTGEQCSHVDFATFDQKWLKGMSAKGKATGLFLQEGKLPKANETVCVVEGVKDAAALSSLGYTVVGLPGSSVKEKHVAAFRACDVLLVPDRDTAGENGARKSAARLHGHAAGLRIATLPGEKKKSGGDGVREVLARQDGEAQVRAALENAREWEPFERNGAAENLPDDGRQQIEVTPEEHLVNKAAVQALSVDPTVFKRNDALVRIVHDDESFDGITRPENSPRIASLPAPIVREKLSRVAVFYQTTTTGDGNERHQQVHPPGWCVSAVHARGHWPGIRQLNGVVNMPVLRPGGSILTTPGYDRATGLLYQPVGQTPRIPEFPSSEQVSAARDLLLDVVEDFPFAKEHHKAAWLASVLTPLARYAFTGPAPLFLIDANVRASGKGLLGDVSSLIVIGRRMAIMSNPTNDDEARKRITALAIFGDPLILIDNIANGLGSASLDAALTGTVWRDRVLGKSEIVELPLNATWYATGNNVVLQADTSRRVCHIRLQSELENPEDRSGFKHPHLKTYVQEHRQNLLGAALTLLRGYFAAGKPDMGPKSWGSFEGWSEIVRNTVVWAGMVDPGEAREELRTQADREAQALSGLMEGWQELDPASEGLTTAQALKLLDQYPDQYELLRESLGELCSVNAGKLPTTGKLGKKLSSLRGRVVGGTAFDYREGRGRSRAWYVETLDHGDDGDRGDADLPTGHSRGDIEPGSDPESGVTPTGETASPASPSSPHGSLQHAGELSGEVGDWGEV